MLWATLPVTRRNTLFSARQSRISHHLTPLSYTPHHDVPLSLPLTPISVSFSSLPEPRLSTRTDAISIPTFRHRRRHTLPRLPVIVIAIALCRCVLIKRTNKRRVRPNLHHTTPHHATHHATPPPPPLPPLLSCFSPPSPQKVSPPPNNPPNTPLRPPHPSPTPPTPPHPLALPGFQVIVGCARVVWGGV